ncbi:hypothetical protein EV424DRAFT_1349346 [Suillus variegatus]|nr:hypothetical protein EV424DRAFT_1349346 [Suillus variegatus]
MCEDLVENIEAGVAQHMAENTSALIEHLAPPASPLPGLASGYGHPHTIFFTYLGIFFVYSFHTAKLTVFVRSASGPSERSATMEKALFSVVLGGLGAVVGANVIVFMMQQVSGSGNGLVQGQIWAVNIVWPCSNVRFLGDVKGAEDGCNMVDKPEAKTGHIGSQAPAEHMIASIVVILGSYTLNFTMSFVHQFDLLALPKAVTILLLVVGIVRKEVFDPQKRLFVLHKEDISASSPVAQHRSTFMHAWHVLNMRIWNLRLPGNY